MESQHMGRTPQFAEVVFSDAQPEGKIIETKITSASSKQLQGHAA
jgi:tRNA A37 methylthiotransferase MiaB